MTVDDVVIRVSQALHGAAVPYMLVGGFSSNYYGIPRSTKDADFVVQLEVPLTQDFAKTLGPDFDSEPQMSFEANTGTQRQEFRVTDTLFKAEVFRLSHDAHDQERFRRRQLVQFQGHRIFFPTAEDVIVWKLRWARSSPRNYCRAARETRLALHPQVVRAARHTRPIGPTLQNSTEDLNATSNANTTRFWVVIGPIVSTHDSHSSHAFLDVRRQFGRCARRRRHHHYPRAEQQRG